jgi:putative transposase
MPYDPDKHHRESIRLKGYDYSQPGAYYVTLCAEGRACIFGEVVEGVITLDRPGEIVLADWFRLPDVYPHVRLDAFQIMPNHVHGIIVLIDDALVGAAHTKRRHTLSEIIRSFKAYTTLRINKYRETPGIQVWQRNYFERIVRDEEGLNAARAYIYNNPLVWDTDRENPIFYP